MANDGNDWLGEALNLALLYGMQKNDGKAPKMYSIPLTPEQKRVEDAKWQLFQDGGSDVTKTVRGLGVQFLSQIPSGAPNHSFISPMMQGQKFAGGMTFPKFDFSKLPMGTNGGSTPPKPASPFPGRDLIKESGSGMAGGGGGGGNFRNQIAMPQRPEDYQVAGGHQWAAGPNYGKDIGAAMYDGYGTAPSGANRPNNYEQDFPTTGGFNDPNRPNAPGSPAQYGDANGAFGKLSEAWTRYKAENPNWAKAGAQGAIAVLTAMTGLPGAIVGRMLGSILLRDSKPPGTGSTPPTTAPAGGN